MLNGKRILITGGAGFIGTNAAEAFIRNGCFVSIFDNLSRTGTDVNSRLLLDRYSDRCELLRGDIRYDSELLRHAVGNSDVILHLAAQVAVTTSIRNPREDFEINAHGTFNLLEAIRNSQTKPLLIYSSTNKVYGRMDDSNLTEQTTRYAYRNHPHGIGESQPLDFHSPYGCSKGTADQYVRDYNRIYDIPSVVFRQSCIYGPHQFGIEDQGWVAWFVIAALSGNPITVYGDGKQVRDVLHVHDLVRAYELAADCPERVNGKIYNIGGGTRYTLSIIELLFYLERRLGHSLGVTFAPWRAGDQRVYISDVRRVQRDLDWSPSIEPLAGVDALLQWVDQHRPLLAKALHIEMFPVMQVNP